MNATMEELAPIVGKLAEKFTAHESTSITYEKAEQLMGAVLYCIHEAEQSGQAALAPLEEVSAQKAYEIGVAAVEAKVRKALDLYNEILPEFQDYGNALLHQSFLKEMPVFFKWYDIRFEPQNTIIALDYPILKDLSAYTGIDKIYDFIACIHLEQMFLRGFPPLYVIRALSIQAHKSDNLCETVLWDVIERIFTGKKLSEWGVETEGNEEFQVESDADWDSEDFSKGQERLNQMEIGDIKRLFRKIVRGLTAKYWEDREELLQYLDGAVDGIAVRLKHATKISNR